MRTRINSSCYRLLCIGLFICLYPIISIRAQTDFPKIDTDQLIAYYNFEGSFVEVYGNFPAAIPYLVDLDTGQFCMSRTAARFASPGSLLKLPELPPLSPAKGFTISVMIYLDASPENETRILSCSDSTNHAIGSYWVSIYPGDNGYSGEPWSFTYVDASGIPHTTKADWGMVAGGWMPYSITYDGASLMMYMGAEPVMIKEVADLELSTATFPVWIGNSESQGFTGKLDNFLLYDRALTEEELYNYTLQYLFRPDEREVTIFADTGDTIVLAAKAKAPFLNYLFKKDEVVLQEGVDSTLVINGLKPEDFGAYTCVIFNCTDAQTKTFIVEQNCQPSDLQITGQTGDLYVYENGSVQFGVQVTGGSESTVYDWFFKGKPIDRHSWQMGLEEVSEADTGYYFCRIQDACETFYSDSIYLGLLPDDVYPYVDTSGILIHYGFNGNFTDSTNHTGPATTQNVQFDSGLFSLPNTAVSFPAPQGSLEIKDTSYLDLNMPFSIILLLKTDALPGSTTPILSKPGTDPGSHGNYSLYVHPDGYLSFGVTGDDDIQYTCTSATPLQPGRWHMVLAYSDNSETGLVIDKNQGLPVTMNGNGLRTNQNNLVIGNLSDESPGLSIDELWIFNRGMKQEFQAFINLFRPRTEVYHLTEGACPPDEVVLSAYAFGPFLQYRFYRDTVTLQEGQSSSCVLQIGDEAGLGDYYCDVYNAYDTITLRISVESDRLYEGLYLYDSNDDLEFYTEHDDVHLSFYVSTNFGGLVYEMYHNGVLMPDVFRGIVVIEDAGPEAMGEYYFVVQNGCERLVSDTVTLVMQGTEYVSYEVQGWDWTSNISGNGNSYFSSISWSEVDSSYVMLGYFSGGLKIEDREYFSSQSDDIFIVKFDQNGNYKWSQVITSPYFKGEGDLVADPQGNIYVSGSYRNSVQIANQSLSTEAGTGCAYLAKYSPDGEFLWLKVVESSGPVSGSNIEYGAGDKIIMGGNFESTLTVGDEVVSGTWDPYVNLMYVVAFDKEGNKEWLNYAVTDQNMLIGLGLVDMELSLSGELIVSGTYSGSVDFGSGVALGNSMEGAFLVKFNANGQPVWAKNMESESGFAETFDVSVDDLDRIFLTGMYINNMSFDTFSIGYQEDLMEEIFLARFDTDGNCTMLRSYGSTGNGGDYGVCFEPVSDSIAYLMGLYGDVLIMGEDTLVADPNSGGAGVSPNMFFCKMTPDGDPLQLVPAGIRGRTYSGEIMAAGEGQVILAGMNEVALVKKSSTATYITLAFAGLKTMTADTAGNPGTDPGTDPGTGLGTPDEVESLFRVYPNPVSKTVYIQTTGASQFDLEIYSMDGVKISAYRHRIAYEVDVSSLTPGVYILKMYMEGEQAYGRLLVQ